MSIKIPEIPKIGKFYWKLNVSMLDRVDIKSDFRTEWNRIKSSISFYDSINDWWELHAKSEIKKFFMYKGREENAKKYGMLEYLEYKLNRLHNRLNKTGEINYSEVKEIKDRITSIKTEILEGVKIRNRMQEQIEGEKVSAYLIGKQNIIKSKKLITEIKVESNIVNNIAPGTVLDKKDSIEWYFNKYYEKLYSKEISDDRYQTWFLQFIENKISGADRQTLENKRII